MNSISITSSKRLKDIVPNRVRRVGFLKLRKLYEYNFVSPVLYREVLCRNPDLRIGEIQVAGIVEGTV